MEPAQIGTYQIIEQLGRGGMGTVYRAHDPVVDRVVAIKVLPREFMFNETFRERFRREAQTLANLEHSAIVPIYDYGETDDGQPYLVMRYMSGGSLADRLQSGPMTPEATLPVVERIGAALDASHRRGIVHRDVKPANIFFDSHGDAYLGDFGIVKLQETTQELTGSRIIGTPSYLAPELANQPHSTPQSDIYALGITLYEMLTGHVPFTASTPIGVILAHVKEPIPDIRTERPDLSVAVQSVITRAMAKHPAHRYQQAGELYQALENAVEQHIADPVSMPSAPPPTEALPTELPPGYATPRPTTKPKRKSSFPWTWVIIGVAGAMILGTCMVGAAMLGIPDMLRADQSTDTPPPVEEEETPSQDPTTIPGDDESPQPDPTEEPTPLATSVVDDNTSPTGHIVFTCFDGSFDQVCIMNEDGSGLTQLTDTEATDFYASLSPDGSRIAFSSRRGGAFDIYLMDTDGNNLTRLTHDQGSNYSPTISPDGTKIVYASIASGEKEQHIWVMNIDGSNPRRVTFDTGDQLDAVWSPDGSQILYASDPNGEGEFNLFIVNADGSNPHQITTLRNIGGRSDWSPDGQHIVFYAGPKDDKDIFIMNADGSNIRQLTDGGDNKAPSFSPDGQWITYASSVDGDNEIWIMRLNGSDQRKLTDNTLADWQPRWGK